MWAARLYLLVGVLPACGFEIASGSANDDAGAGDGTTTADAPGTSDTPDTPLQFDAVHVPPAGQVAGTGDLTLANEVDTTTLSIDGSSTLPAGVTFDTWPQPGGGADLAVLHVRTLHVPSAAMVRVTGSRALIVIAAGDIRIDGRLDGGARRELPGAGGGLPDAGYGSGPAGGHADTFRDSGGGGAGFATTGGIGGRADGCIPSAPQVAGGVVYGGATLPLLHGGSGGGSANPSTCGRRRAGAGGGAIQLSSATRVAISGVVNVSGGGGGGGLSPQTQSCDMSAGSGGGSGGSLYLQSPQIVVTGQLAANGGAGGSSAGDAEGNNTFPSANGVDGQDGMPGTTPAAPGNDVGVWSSAGGAGGARSGVAGGGAHNGDCDGNGGAGGGSVGRIVVAIPSSGSASITGDSPQAIQTTY